MHMHPEMLQQLRTISDRSFTAIISTSSDASQTLTASWAHNVNQQDSGKNLALPHGKTTKSPCLLVILPKGTKAEDSETYQLYQNLRQDAPHETSAYIVVPRLYAHTKGNPPTADAQHVGVLQAKRQLQPDNIDVSNFSDVYHETPEPRRLSAFQELA